MLNARLVSSVMLALCLTAPQAAPLGLGAAEHEAPQRLPGVDCPMVVRILARGEGAPSWLEPWEVDPEQGAVVAGIDLEGLDRLHAEGYTFTIDEELTERACSPPPIVKGQSTGIPGFPCYATVEETFQRAIALVAARPDLAEWIDVGDSWIKSESPDAGYDLMVLKLTNRAKAGTGTPADPGAKPKVFIMASVHAREYAPAELVTRFAELLVHQYDRDPDITWILDEHEIHILLHANPDGRKHAEAGILWRKNVDNDFCSDTDMRGIDLNRNFEYMWACCGGSSPIECDEIYRGPDPASEPETATIQSYVRNLFPAQWTPQPPRDSTGVFLDMHSYGGLILWPWGYTFEEAPNASDLQSLGRKLGYFNLYQPRQAIGFYPTDGTTTDFAYGDLGVAAYTIELGTWFFESCESFETDILEPNLEVLLYAAKVARTPYVTPLGPDIESISLAPSTFVAQGASLATTVIANDGRFSDLGGVEPSQPIAAVEITLDAAPWDPTVFQTFSASPVDGVFDSFLEEASAVIDTTTLSPGRHTLFVRAQDEEGNWGAVSAAFFWVHPDSRIRNGGARVP